MWRGLRIGNLLRGSVCGFDSRPLPQPKQRPRQFADRQGAISSGYEPATDPKELSAHCPQKGKRGRMNLRELRGMELAETRTIRKRDRWWWVPSQPRDWITVAGGLTTILAYHQFALFVATVKVVRHKGEIFWGVHLWKNFQARAAS